MENNFKSKQKYWIIVASDYTDESNPSILYFKLLQIPQNSQVQGSFVDKREDATPIVDFNVGVKLIKTLNKIKEINVSLVFSGWVVENA